jgi:hypothetical protein
MIEAFGALFALSVMATGLIVTVFLIGLASKRARKWIEKYLIGESE